MNKETDTNQTIWSRKNTKSDKNGGFEDLLVL